MSRNHIGHETGITRLTGIAEAIGAEKEVRVVEGITSAGVRVDGIEVEQAHKGVEAVAWSAAHRR